MKVGDKVVRNTKQWEPNDFDSCGRGRGVGEIVEPPFELEPGHFDVQWPEGRCFEKASQIKLWNQMSSTM